MLEFVATLELFATKGVEYLIVMGYLLLLVPIWLLLTRTRTVERVRQATRRAARWAVDWFSPPEGFWFHRGHTWAVPEAGDDIVRVGLDELAETLVGEPTAIHLPERGRQLDLGERAWQLEVDGRRIDMLSPVRGEVVTVNEAVVASPDLLRDPYGAGWLLEVRVPKRATALKNLLTGGTARAWMNETVEALRARMSTDVGITMQDGGAPVEGFVRHLSPDGWDKLAAEFFLTADASEETTVGVESES